MKPVEGVNLTDLLKQVEDERIVEIQKAIKVKIAHVLGKTAEAVGSITNLKKQLAKAEEKYGKLQAQLKALEAGDWNALQDEGPADGGKPEQEQK